MQLTEPPMAEDTLDEQLDAEDADDVEETGEVSYVPDPQIMWGAEVARAMLVVLTRRFGADFAREVSDELSSRMLSYKAGCPDDRRDGTVMNGLICDKLWDELFQMNGSALGGRSA